MSNLNSTHKSIVFVIMTLDGVGSFVLAINSKQAQKYRAPGGRNENHPEETPAETAIFFLKKETGLVVADIGEPFYVDKKKIPPRYYYFVRYFVRPTPGAGEKDSYWVRIKDYLRNPGNKMELLYAQRPAFQFLVTEVLSRDPVFARTEQGLIVELCGGKEPSNILMKFLGRIKTFLRAR